MIPTTRLARPAADSLERLAGAARRPTDRDGLDFLRMEARDRLTNLGFFAGAGIVWILVALVLTTRDPRIDTTAGYVGALLIGLAIGLTVVPLFWLAIFDAARTALGDPSPASILHVGDDWAADVVGAAGGWPS